MSNVLYNHTGRNAQSGGGAVWIGCYLGVYLLFLAASAASGGTPKQVLLLHSFGREYAPFNTFSDAFRTELGQQFDGPVEFHDAALESARLEGGIPEGPLVGYLTALFSARRLDLIVTVGGPAARFAQQHRQQLFPATPMLLSAVDERLVQREALTTNDTAVAVTNDLVRLMNNVLQLLPDTANLAVVVGNSALEKFWLGEMRRQFQVFTNRLSFSWYNDLSFDEMRKRAAVLPPHSAILYAVLSMDAEGVPYLEERALRGLHAVANAPIFGLHDSQLGKGVVGGPVMAFEELSRNAAKVAVRILNGEPAGSIKTPTQTVGRPVYDWRELKRWGISEDRLPPGSEIRFRQPTVWELHKWRIVAVILFCLLQAAVIVLLAMNLARRRRAERSLRESEELNRATFEQAAVGIAHVGTDGRWLRVNDRLCTMVGYPRAELLQLTFRDLTHPEDLNISLEYLRRILAGEIKSYSFEKRYLRKDRSQVWVNLTVSLVPTVARECRYFIAVIEDIMERKRAEAELLRQRADLAHIARVSTMGELASSMAHELNQPLGAILANAEAGEIFLEQQPPALDEVRAALAAIRQDDERAGEVIRRMRALLRKRELEQEPLAVNSLVETVLQLLSSDAALRGIALDSDLVPGLPNIAGDRIHLQQVLLNLILNSMDAVGSQPRERRRVLVRTRSGAEAGVEVAVIDAGHGIEPDHLPHLFEPFYTTKPNGMGMGLSIARTIIEAHHGRIWAENSASGGATFRIALPPACE